MKIKKVFLLITILFTVSLIGVNRSLSAKADEQKRVRFQIVAAQENSTERKVLSQTTIEGLAGTDFNVNLQTANFKLHASFICDLVAPDKLKIKSKLDTRRFYGYSPANLPLYEEDAQNHTLILGFDENIVLLPFGRNSGGSGNETLKIEITPTLFADVSSAESSDALKININKPLPSGEITVEAFKNPHRFQVEAIVLADGREIARGTSEVLFDEEQEIRLAPNTAAKNSAQLLTAKFTVNKYTRNRPQDFVGIGYRIFQAHLENQAQTEILSGSGIAILGNDLRYQLNNNQLADDKKYELRFNVRAALSEQNK